MSYQMEMNHDHDNQEEKDVDCDSIQSVSKSYFIRNNWQMIIKLIQMVFSVVCAGLIFEPIIITNLGKTHLHHVAIMCTAFMGCLLINFVLLVSRGMKDRVPYRTICLFALMSCALFLVSGIILAIDRFGMKQLYFYHPKPYLLTMIDVTIVFAFLNAILFGVESKLTVIMKRDF